MKAALAFILALTLCSVANAQNDVEALKKEILELARSYSGQADASGELQASIETKVDELLAIVPNLSMEEKALRALGAWRQVWGPYSYDNSASVPRGIDVNQIYQIIFKEGYYYNFAVYNFLGIESRTFLRGNFSIEEDRIAVEFNKSGLILGKSQLPLPYQASALENQSLRALYFPDFLPPNGITGALIELYADQDIRINYGVIGDDVSQPVIFVMEPVKMPGNL